MPRARAPETRPNVPGGACGAAAGLDGALRGGVAALVLGGGLSGCGDAPAPPAPPEPSLGTCVPTATLRLDPGEATAFTTAGGEPACVSLAQTAATYSVAYFDPRLVALEAEGREPTAPPLDDFVIDAELRAGGQTDVPPGPSAARIRAAAGERRLPPIDRTVAGAPAAACDPPDVPSILCRQDPWTRGDRFPAPSRDPRGEREAQVLAIGPGNRLVVAAYVEDLPEPGSPLLQALGEGLALVHRHTFPILRSAFPGVEPVTSPGSGQLLLVVRRDDDPISVARVRRVDGGLRHWIELSDLGGRDFHFTLVSHEVAHSYQLEFSAGGGWARWAIEGGADLVKQEALRRRAGVPAGSDFEPAEARGEALEYALAIDRVDGALAAGYYQSSAFLRHLHGLASDAGADDATILRELLQGSLHGWTGSNPGHPAPVGLAQRMESLLREGPWDPVEAVLDWTVSNAIDDRWPGSAFRNREVLRAWRDRPTARRPWRGWMADAEIGAGAPVTVRREAGATGYLETRTTPEAHALRLRTGVAARWRIVRHR